MRNGYFVRNGFLMRGWLFILWTMFDNNWCFFDYDGGFYFDDSLFVRLLLRNWLFLRGHQFMFGILMNQ
jgi:hypothetical protein